MSAELDILPILRAQEEYEGFISTEKNLQFLRDRPESFPALTSKNANYLRKLNYQFLELDGREKFLRYLNQGSVLRKEEIQRVNEENKKLSVEVERQRQGVDVTKREVEEKSEKVVKVAVKEVQKRAEAVKELEDEVAILQERKQQLAKDNGDYEGKSLAQLEQMDRQLMIEISQLEGKITSLEGERDELETRIEEGSAVEQSLALESQSLSSKIKEYETASFESAEASPLRARVQYLNGLLGTWSQL